MDDQGLLSYQPKQTLSPKNYMLTWSHCASNIFRISHRYVFHPNWTQNDHWRHFHWWKIDIYEALQLIFLLQSFQMLIITHEASVQCDQSKGRLLQLQIQALQVTECGYKKSSSKFIMAKPLKWGMLPLCTFFNISVWCSYKCFKKWI